VSSDPLRVLVADDHPLFRRGLRALLEAASAIEVVGDVADGEEVVRLSLETRPDVVVMDIRMPALNGIEATRRILQAHPETRVLVLTMFEDDDSVFAAMRAGARGYLLKGSDQDEVLRAIRTVGAGGAIFGPAIAARLVAYFSAKRSAAFPQLTGREREVLELLASGSSNQAIARHLALSLKTVRNHVSTIFNKLRVADRDEAISKARDAGLGHPDDRASRQIDNREDQGESESSGKPEEGH
jgi:DNA-binding NarL/FixJ family response regulator